MAVLEVIALLAVGFGIVMAISGRWQGMAPSQTDRPQLRLPLTADEIDSVELSVAVRGYRMDEVDAVLAACADAIRERDAVIAAMKASS